MDGGNLRNTINDLQIITHRTLLAQWNIPFGDIGGGALSILARPAPPFLRP